MSDLASQATERAVARTDPRKATVLDLIRQQKGAIEVALPSHIGSERFTRTILTEVNRTPALLTCDPMSLLAACMLSAQLGLELGPLGHAYLVPFKGKVTFIIGYKGMVDLARRSGQVSSIQAHAVHQADKFEYRLGLNPDIVHVPAEGDRGPMTHVYAVAKYKDGGFNMVVLTRADVDKFKARSATANASHSPWQSDYEAMAMKTAVRRLFPWLPVTPEMAQTMATDEATPAQITRDIAAALTLELPDTTDDADEAEDGTEDAEIIDVEEVDDEDGAWDTLTALLAAGPPSGTKDQVMAQVQKLAFAVGACGLEPVTTGINSAMGKDELVAAAGEAWNAAGLAFAAASDADYEQGTLGA